jgi:hypothetical protein
MLMFHVKNNLIFVSLEKQFLALGKKPPPLDVKCSVPYESFTYLSNILLQSSRLMGGIIFLYLDDMLR